MTQRFLLTFSFLSLLLATVALFGSTQYVARELRCQRQPGRRVSTVAGLQRRGARHGRRPVALSATNHGQEVSS